MLQRRFWLGYLFYGILMVLFGAFILSHPKLTLGFLIILFGAFTALAGIIVVCSALYYRKMLAPWRSQLLSGLGTLCIGILVLAMPGVTGLILIYLMAAWAAIFGISELSHLIVRRVEKPMLPFLTGVVAIIFAVYLVIEPFIGVAVLMWPIGLFAVCGGVLYILQALALRKIFYSHHDP